MYNGYNVDPALLESIDKLSKSLTEQFRAQLENEPSLRISPAAVERLNDILKEHFDESSRKAADFLSSIDNRNSLSETACHRSDTANAVYFRHKTSFYRHQLEKWGRFMQKY